MERKGKFLYQTRVEIWLWFFCSQRNVSGGLNSTRSLSLLVSLDSACRVSIQHTRQRIWVYAWHECVCLCVRS